MNKFRYVLVASAFVAVGAMPAPASAAYMVATWQGTIVSGSVSGTGGPVDGLAQGDYSGQAFTASILYDSDPSAGQMYYNTPGVSSYLYGGNGFGVSPILNASLTVGGVTIDLTSSNQGLVQQQQNNGMVTEQSVTQWNLSSFSGDGFQFESFIKGLSFTGYGDIPAALDQEYSVNFDPSDASTGTASDCDVIDTYGSQFSESVPHCLSFNLKPTSLTLVDPPGPLGAVPEPAVWALMLSGFGLAGAMLRRRRQDARIYAA